MNGQRWMPFLAVFLVNTRLYLYPVSLLKNNHIQPALIRHRHSAENQRIRHVVLEFPNVSELPHESHLLQD